MHKVPIVVCTKMLYVHNLCLYETLETGKKCFLLAVDLNLIYGGSEMFEISRKRLTEEIHRSGALAGIQ